MFAVFPYNNNIAKLFLYIELSLARIITEFLQFAEYARVHKSIQSNAIHFETARI